MTTDCLTQLLVGGGVEYSMLLDILGHLSILGGITIAALIIQKAESYFF